MSWSHAGHFDEALVNSTTGVPLANTAYQVFQSDGTTLATIYSNRSRTGGTVSQPLTSNAQGNAEFWCDPQPIVIAVSGGTPIATDVYPDVIDLGALNNALLNTQDNNLNGHFITNALVTEYMKTGDYVVASGDALSTVGYNSGSQGTWSLPQTLPLGWQIGWYQKGAGQIFFNPTGNAQLKNANNHTKSRTTDAGGYLEVTENSDGNHAIYRLYGDTSA